MPLGFRRKNMKYSSKPSPGTSSGRVKLVSPNSGEGFDPRHIFDLVSALRERLAPYSLVIVYLIWELI